MQGKSALVTGGSRGIGKAIALRFARDGAARVAIGYYRNDEAAAQTAEELRALGAEPVLVRGNISGDRVCARSPSSARSTSSSTMRQRASSGPRSRSRTSTGTGR